MLWIVRVCLCVCLVAGQRHPPNIVIIMADDMGWNDVGYHGSNEIPTPNIDALAMRGIMLERYYASPTCTPSRTAFLTGKYPFRLGMQGPPISGGQPRGIPLNENLLPQYMKHLGYATHLVGKWHVGHYTPKHTPTFRGFDSFLGYYHGAIGYYDAVFKRTNTTNAEPASGIDAVRNLENAYQEFAGNYATDLFTDEAVKIIQKHDSAKPLYLQVNHLAPHAGSRGAPLEVRSIAETMGKYEHIKDYNRRLYAGMMEALDDSVGKIITTLKTKGLLENSIIVFMSDNGAPTYDPTFGTANYGSNWPLRGLKSSLHEGGVRVPAVIYSPLLSNSVSSLYFHVTDWLPTLYEAAGGDICDLWQVDGISQWGALNGFEEQNRRYTIVVDIDETNQQSALIQDNWKIIKHTKKSLLYANDYYGSSGRQTPPKYNLTAVVSSPTHIAIGEAPNTSLYEYKRHLGTIDSRCELVIRNGTSGAINCTDFCLFDIEQDPCETTDLSRENPALVQTLVNILEAYEKFLVPRNNFTVDERSHPRYWCNRWVPWIDVGTT